MAHPILTELNDMQMEMISGGNCHRHHHHHCERGGMGGGLLGELKGLIASLGKVAAGSNISIIIIANSTINAPVSISVNQGISV